MQYLSHRDALDYVQREAGLSRETFDLNIRPRLLERRYGERVVRFSRLAIDQALADPTFEEGSMKLPRRRILADALEHVWKSEWQFQKGSRSQKRLVDMLCKDKLAAKRLRTIKYEDLVKWVNTLRDEGLAEATIARRLSAIMQALKVAKTLEWVDRIPDKPKLHIRNAKNRYLTYEEEARLLNSMQPPLKHVTGFLLDTGCRLSELMRLRPQDVVDDGAIFLDRKDGGNLKVPLTARAQTAIRALHRDPWWQHWTRNVHDDDKGLRDVALETLRTRLSRDFRAACKVAKLSGVSIHTCRHTCASRLAQAGKPMHIIQALLGHSDISVTSKRYAHLAPNSLMNVLDVLERQESDNVVPIDKQRTSEH